MKWSAAFSVFLFVSTAAAQPTIGTITGTVTNPDGSAAAGIVVQAKNVENGTVHDVKTLDTGQYTLNVPQGAYDLIVPAVESKSDRYEQKNVVVTAAQFFYADIRLRRGNGARAEAVDQKLLAIKERIACSANRISIGEMSSPPMGGITRRAWPSTGSVNV